MAVAAVGSNKTGFFMNLTPLFSIVLSILFLGETLHLYHLAGFALILSGIYLTSARR